ncbi:hypothetical protein EDC94DRAFT_585880 [Helicostylum pulchrum]|nr:hypothetical protein EDC94DRAFT_585880 [Helicostylum pulchrum]
MEQELYYLIAKFLAAGPCKDAARVLETELKQHCELLPHTITYEGKKVPMTMDRLSREYPNITNNYLLELIGRFLCHFKETGDPKILRVSALRHGDKSLLTMLSAFIHNEQIERCNYLTMTRDELEKLSLHRMLIAREMGAKVIKKNEMPTALSTFYRERVTISGHRNPVYCVAFDKTNRRLFTGSDDFLVKVWCVRTGYLIHTIRGHQNIITDIAINQENTLIATASSDGYVRVWTMDEYKPIMSLRPNASTIKPFTTVKFSPSPRAETRYLMATNEDGIVRLWKWDRDTLQFFDIDTPITFSCKFRAKDRLRCSSFNYTGTKFTVAGDDGFVYVFSTIQIKTAHEGVIATTEDTRPVGRGRKRVASALFPDKSGQVQAQPVVPIGTLEGHMGSVTDLAYSHDGQRILSGCQDGTARIWKFDKESKVWSSIALDVKISSGQCTVVKPNNTPFKRKGNKPKVLTDDSDEIGSLMPFMDEDESPTTDMDVDVPSIASPMEPAKVSMIAWSADDRWCFVASNHGEIRVYYAYNGEIACVLKGHEGEIYALDNHPLDPSTILSAGYDGKVILWDVEKQKVITCRNHVGRTFTDCKFSKDAMKYAITDEEGHCTLFSIGGLDKDYEQVRSWERGQYFMSDYQALRHFADGTFLDEPTQQSPYALQPSPIIDLQGVAYPNQKKFGYGRTIPTTSETFELEDMKRSACYDLEEEEIRTMKVIVLPAVDRASIAKRRREFVRFDDDDDADIAAAATQLQFPPPPVLPLLLPDDSADEDYHDEDEDGEPGNAAYASSGASSDEGGSDDFVARDGDVRHSEEEQDEEGPVTRSRAGQLGTPARTPSRNTAHVRRGASSSRRRGRGRSTRGGSGRGRGGGSGVSSGRSTRKRNRERSDDEEEQPVRARARRRVTEIPSYVESDLESEEEEFVDVDQEGDSEAHHSDNSEAGPSNSAQHIDIHNNNYINHNTATSSTSSSSTSRRSNAGAITNLDQRQPEDRKGKRKLRSAAATASRDSDDDFMVPPEPYHSTPVATNSSNGGRATRSRNLHQVETHTLPPPPPSPPIPTTLSIKKQVKHRDGPRELSEDEIKQHEPIPWITTTEKSLTKYLPQMGDYVAILTEGHRQYLRSSDMKQHFDEKYGVIDKHEPVLFGKVVGITWLVGPPAYCKLKLAMMELVNISKVIITETEEPLWASLKRDQIIEYSDEDGCPEFIVLWQRFLASMSMFKTLRVGQKVDAIYDEGQYTGTISNCNPNGLFWKRANLPSPWAYYHVIWDDTSSTPEDLCPWELVPTGEDFKTRYNVEPSLTPAQVRRAKDILTWLSSSDEFLLYVHQVNYYDYPPYLSLIAYPICLDMIQERLRNNFYRSIEGLIDDVELVKKNAMRYNADTSAAHKNAIRLANFFKTRLTKPSMPLAWSRGGGGGNRKKVIIEESDDEYDNQGYESEEEPMEKKSLIKERTYRSDDDEDEDDFVNDDEEDDYYE